MNFWENAADSVTKAVDFIVDKNRKTAMMNRLKIVIRNEKEKQAAAYIQLGKYYYRSLRDAENGDTEPFCCTVDRTGERLKRAYEKLDELAVPTEAEPKPSCCCGDAECCGEEYDDDEYSDEPDETAAEEQENDIPEEAFRQEAADDDEDYLHPFTVVPNDDTLKEENPAETGEGAAEPEEKAGEDKKPEENTAENNEVPNPTEEPTNF